MPFARIYELSEVKGMLAIFEGNRLDMGTWTTPPAHAAIHAGATITDQVGRVTTVGETRRTGTYWNSDDQAAGTLHILNSHAGQIALGQLDAGQNSVTMQVALPPNTYRMAFAVDDTYMPGQAGHIGKNNPLRATATATETISYATQGFVKVYKAIGGLMQIQTTYPIP